MDFGKCWRLHRNLETFLNEMNNEKLLVPRPNPFFNSFVSFLEQPDYQVVSITQKRQLFTQIVKPFGQKIVHLWLGFSRCRDPVENCERAKSIYNFIRSLLILMPNLMSLTILFSGYKNLKDYGNMNVETMNELLESNPLPTLN